MATKRYLDQAGLQLLWNKICSQDRDLLNKVTINSNKIDEIIGQIGHVKVLYDTTVNWNEQFDLIGEAGTIYIYSDAKTYEGQLLPRIKVGNGVSYLRNTYFVDQDIVHQLENIVTVSQAEKDKWNNKVTCFKNQETLVFTKD